MIKYWSNEWLFGWINTDNEENHPTLQLSLHSQIDLAKHNIDNITEQTK